MAVGLIDRLRARLKCRKPSCCEEACCEPACEPECCEPECCQPCCKRRGRTLLGFLDNLMGCRKPCRTACCEAVGCGSQGAAPAAAPAEEASPLPIAPKADASAALVPSDIYRVSRRTVRY
jgi:hypothetical protein